MRVTSAVNGQHFGNLAKVSGIVTYKMSPFEQRAFAGVISKGLPNVFRRIRANVFRVVPSFVVGYIIYDMVEKEHTRLTRKNPAEFANDQ